MVIFLIVFLMWGAFILGAAVGVRALTREFNHKTGRDIRQVMDEYERRKG